MIETIQKGDVIVNARAALTMTGNRSPTGSEFEFEVYSLKNGASKGTRWYRTEAVFQNLDKNWRLFRTA